MSFVTSPVPTGKKPLSSVLSPIVSHPLVLSEWDGGDGEAYAQMLGANPLKTDPELKQRLAELPGVNTYKDFTRWRRSFLKRYEFFLEQSGTGEAQPAYDRFCKELNKLHTLTLAVQDDLQNTKHENKTDDEEPALQVKVSTRRRLAEWNKQLGRMILALTALTPATLELEKACGYSKFQLGALLVRNGFAEYNALAFIEEACDELREKTCLEQIADRQVVESMVEYQKKLAIFCDIMADLGLYQAMLKCHDMNQLRGDADGSVVSSAISVTSSAVSSVVETAKQEEEVVAIEEPTPTPPPQKEKKVKKKKSGVEKKKKADPEPPINPFTYRLTFPALKPPSSPFIKYVETNAKSMDEVTPGIHPRGKLKPANGSAKKNDDEEDFDQEWDEAAEEAAYKPMSKPSFQYGYHGGKDNDSWRVSKGHVPISSPKHKTTKSKATSATLSKHHPDDDDSTSSYGHDDNDHKGNALSSEEED